MARRRKGGQHCGIFTGFPVDLQHRGGRAVERPSARRERRSIIIVMIGRDAGHRNHACWRRIRILVRGRYEWDCCEFLLATRLVDELPELVGIESLYGMSVHHCLYCDGFEYAGRPVAAYGKGDKVAELAVMMKHWMSDVVACSDGTELSAKATRKLGQHSIPLRRETIERIEGENGKLTKIVFTNGSELPRHGLFFSTGCHQASDLADRLGCERDERGGIVTDAVTGETGIPGVFVAGDVSRDVLLVAVAVAEGAQAAVAVNQALLRRDGFCE